MPPKPPAPGASCRLPSRVMRRAPTSSASGFAVRADGTRPVQRTLPEEVPVALVFNGTTQAVMMATPADLEDFALGFALGEGIVTDPDQVESTEIVIHDDGLEARLWLSEDRARAMAERRRSMAGPVGCGLCGIDSLAQANRSVPSVAGAGLRLSPDRVAGATEALRPLQALHRETGATHAAGFLTPNGRIACAREDVGRHNALDKLIGALVRAGIDPAGGAIVLTSRISVELVQKAAQAGCPMLIALSAPTAYAVRTAELAGVTLVAFARNGGFDVYCHPHRITDEVSSVA